MFQPETSNGNAGRVVVDRPESDAYVFRASSAQRRFWFLHQLQSESSAYNLPIVMRVDGRLDRSILETSLQTIVSRHEILRTRFDQVDNEPVQIVYPTCDFKMQLVDLSNLAASARESAVEREVNIEIRRPFDLRTGPLFKGVLYSLSEDLHVLLLNMHHIVADGWSFKVILTELGSFYQAHSEGKRMELDSPPVQFADYAEWEHDVCSSPDFAAKLGFWRSALAGAPAFLDLPITRPRPGKPSLDASITSRLLPSALTKNLKQLALQNGSTLFMVSMAAFKILLYRYTKQKDIVLGSPVANRNLSQIEDLIGCFVNTAIFRTQLSADLTFIEVLARIREWSLEAYANQDVPIDKIVEDLQPERSLDRNPLFQILFSSQKAFIQPINLPGLSFTPLRTDRKGTQTDMMFFLVEREEGLRVACEYRVDLFDSPRIDRLLGHFETLLKSIVENPSLPIGKLGMLPSAEKNKIVARSAISETTAPNSGQIHRLFEEQAGRVPNAVAVTFGSQQVTYSELNGRANSLASHLLTLGVGPEVLVGICTERSLEMIVGILAILKAGGAYVPLDPTYPDERLTYVLGDSGTDFVLTQQSLVDRFAQYSGRIVTLESTSKDFATLSSANIHQSDTSEESPAYVIYTSGSTGAPKGVVVTHRNIVRLLRSTDEWFGFNERDVWTMFHSFAFDFSVWEMWGALAYGGRLVIVPYLLSRSPAEFYKLLCDEGVTVLNQTPSAFRVLIKAEETTAIAGDLALRYVIFGGEALDLKSLQPWTARHGAALPKLINMYGITETTVHVTYRELTETDISLATGSLIGRSIPDLGLYILDENLEPVPEGVPGEIYVAGAGLARGYLNRPDMTAERFIPNPFTKGGDSRLYKTGDLARRLESGEIEYLGRSDNQVKIRGFRVELGEIESAIAEFDDVSEVVVRAQVDSDGDKKLVAYLVSASHSKIEVVGVRSFLKKKLPGHMIPSTFIQLEAFPLNTNGKVDLKALPVHDTDMIPEREGVELPGNETEKALARIWTETLGIDTISVTDNFFDLGGHSLLAIKMFSEVEEKFGKTIPLATLFEAGTVRSLAAIISASVWQESESSLVPIKPSGTKSPLFCLHAGGGNVLFYQDLAKYLKENQPVYGLQARRVGGRQVAHDTVEEMAEFYISEIKKFQPNGPYHLCGSSFGGLLGLEIAQRLRQRGDKIGLLALFDTNGPSYPQFLNQTTPLKKKAYRLVRRLQHHRDSLKGLNAGDRMPYLLNKLKKLKLSYKRKFRMSSIEVVRAISLRFGTGKALEARYRQLENKIGKANSRYRPKRYPGKMTLFRATNQPLGIVPDHTLGWSGIPADLEIFEVAGHHGSIVAEPYVRKLATLLTDCLESAQGRCELSDQDGSTGATPSNGFLENYDSISTAYDPGRMTVS